jgi:O-antigen ligase/tetratricopeptide (TPR) repeat protein
MNKSSQSTVKPPIRWGYLLSEAALFLLLCYLTIIGGINYWSNLVQPSGINLGLALLIGGGWLAWRILRRSPFPATWLDLPVLVMLAITVVTSLTSVDPRRSAVLVWQLLLYTLVFYLLVDLLRSGLAAELLEKTILLSSLPVIVVGLGQIISWIVSWYALGSCTSGFSLPSFRIYPLLAQSNIFAGYLNLILPLGLVRSLRSRRWTRAAWAAWSLVILGLEFFTSSRGGWVGTATVLGILGLYLAWDRLRSFRTAGRRLKSLWEQLRRRKVMLGGIAVGLVVVAAAGIGLMAWELNNASHVGSGLNLSSRTYIWAVAWKMFMAHPLTGNGPLTYATQFIQAYSIPSDVLLPHAHNIVINVLGESGLLGIAALAFFAWALVGLIVRRWRGTSGSDRLVLVGLVASLGGLAMHSMFDIPTYLPVVAILAVCVVAMIAAGNQSESPRPVGIFTAGRWGWPVVSCAWLLVAGVLAWQAWAYPPFFEGVAAANAGDWKTGAVELDQAAERDPRLAYTWFQAGFAHGMLALDASGRVIDPGELEQARQDYQRGLAIEPTYSTNWADLGLLDWAAGDQQGALAALQKAAEAAPEQAAFRLTWGRMLEASGQVDAAQAAYRQVLLQQPGWVNTYFFRATPLREQVVAASPAASLVVPPQALSQSPLNCRVRLAWFIDIPPTDLIDNLFALGSSASQQGKLQEAVQFYEQGLMVLGATNSWGIGQEGYSNYPLSVYKYPSIAKDLLPGLDYPIYTDGIVQSMLALADDYQKTGDTSSAIRVYNKIIQVAPDNKAAQVQLAELSPK